MKKEKLLIVDGHALLFQSFFGMPAKIKNSHGQYIEAVICFVGILLKTIKAHSPSSLVIIFDSDSSLARRDIDPDYKQNRPSFQDAAEEDHPFDQLKIIYQVLDYLKFSYTEAQNIEADDLIAQIVKTYKDTHEVIIFSPDRDFFQLIDEDISCFIYRGKLSKLWDSQTVQKHYGFDAKYFSVLKSLTGDPSDNIKGIKGIGIKTATALIKQFGSLQNIINNADKISPLRISQMIKENKTLLEKNFSIIDLSNAQKIEKNKDFYYSLPEVSCNQILKELNLS